MTPPDPSQGGVPSNEAGPTDPDPFWWAPFAVLIVLVAIGMLGYLGKLGPDAERGGDAPPTSSAPAPSASG